MCVYYTCLTHTCKRLVNLIFTSHAPGRDSCALRFSLFFKALRLAPLSIFLKDLSQVWVSRWLCNHLRLDRMQYTLQL